MIPVIGAESWNNIPVSLETSSTVNSKQWYHVNCALPCTVRVPESQQILNWRIFSQLLL